MNKIRNSQIGGSYTNQGLTWFTSVLAILLGIVLGMGVAPAYAVDGDPPGLFELEGDPFDDVEALPDDWNMLHYLDPNTGGSGFGGQPYAFTGIIADPAPMSIYWKGGSKDVLDIPNWWHKDGSVPDKDDITNAFAAGYLVPEDVCLDSGGVAVLCSDPTAAGDPVHFTGDLIIYFGMDRYANNGDAFAGFWFLQDKVTLTDQQFDGEHVALSGDGPGDLLALVEYPQASDAVPTIKVYEWDPMDYDGDGNLDEDNHSLGPLDLIITVENAECDGEGDKLACAISNLTEINGPDWDYTPKGGLLGDNYPFETFYEGGINVTRLLGGQNICIATFLAETRSSRSETAQLKDLVLGNFDLCGSDVTTQIHDPDHNDITFKTVKAGTAIHDEATVTIIGPGLTIDPTGSVTFTLYNNGTCDIAGYDSEETIPIVFDGTYDQTTAVEGSPHTLAAGKSYSFHAVFNSDNTDFPDAALAVCEVITIEKYPSKIRTEIHQKDTGHAPDIQGETVYVGLTIHDHAFVEPDGTFTSPPIPSGNVVFTLFDKIDCTGNTSVSTVALSGGAAISADNTPLGDTFLSYSASYSGDANYLAATDAVCEPLTIIKYDSELSTQIHVDADHINDVQGGTIPVLTVLHDHAYWDGILDEDFPGAWDLNSDLPVPEGNVTFELFKTADCTGESLPAYGGISWPQSDGLNVTVHPGYDTETAPFTPPVGQFSIKASWAEDDNYQGSTAACEELIIELLPPVILTKVMVRDLAQVSAKNPGPQPEGTVTFTTYSSNDCTGDPVGSEEVTLSSSGMAAQTSEQLLEFNPDVVSYRAEYSGSEIYDGIVHDCEVVQFSVLTP